MPRKPATVYSRVEPPLGNPRLLSSSGPGANRSPLRDESRMLATSSAETYASAASKPLSLTGESSNSKSVRALPLALG